MTCPGSALPEPTPRLGSVLANAVERVFKQPRAGTSYRDAIERAVKYGNDTDTTAAITGGLAGLRWGLDERESGIPRLFLSALRGKDVVEELLGPLLR